MRRFGNGGRSIGIGGIGWRRYGAAHGTGRFTGIVRPFRLHCAHHHRTLRPAMKRKSNSVPCSHSSMRPVASLKPNPRNPNRHSPSQIKLLAKIIKHQGFRSPIVVSRRSGLVVAGHGRIDAAKLLGLKTVPVDEQEFASDADEMAHMVADNRIAELAELDLTALPDIMAELREAHFDLDMTGYDVDALHDLDLSAGQGEQKISEDACKEFLKKWKVKPGQIWTAGPHRLLCGDSTKEKDVNRLISGAQPILMVTD